MAAPPPRKHDPSLPIATREDVEDLLLAGHASGEPRPVTGEDWKQMCKRALGGLELRKND